MGNLEQGITPTNQAILEDRSVYFPPEPSDAAYVEDLWTTYITAGDETRLGDSVYRAMRQMLELSDVSEKARMEESVSLPAVEWYIHEHASDFANGDERSSHGFDTRVVAALLNGIVTLGAVRSETYKGRFVIPEELDHVVDHLHYVFSFSKPVDLTYVGNVGKSFGEALDHGTKLRLVGSAVSDLAWQAGRRVPWISDADRPYIHVSGSTGEYTAYCTTSLNLRIDGNCGSESVTHARAKNGRFDQRPDDLGVFVRVNGEMGDNIGAKSEGKVFISAGKIASLGCLGMEFGGRIEEGPDLYGGRNKIIVGPQPSKISGPKVGDTLKA